MTWARSIQFRGLESVVKAYESTDIPGFALFAGNQLLKRCSPETLEDGSYRLREYVEQLAADNSAGQYTLCMYEDMESLGKITHKTPCDGSFNFMLADYLPDGMHRGGNAPAYQEILSKLNAVQEKQLQLEQQLQEEDDEPQQDTLGRILENPLVQQYGPAVVQWLVGLLNKKPPTMTAVDDIPESHKIAGINQPDQNIPIDPEKKIEAGLQILRHNQPDFPDIIFKLGQLKLKRPAEFAMYILMLKQKKL